MRDLFKLNVAKALKSCPKSTKLPNLVTLLPVYHPADGLPTYHRPEGDGESLFGGNGFFEQPPDGKLQNVNALWSLKPTSTFLFNILQ